MVSSLSYIPLSLAILLASNQYASAAATSNSAPEPGRDGFVVGDGRSTMDLVWSCLATIFTCVWVAQHPDLIEPNDPKMPIGLTQLKFIRMIGFILAPEYLAQAAFSEWWAARQFTSKMRAKGCQHWTNKHSFLVLMRGLSYKPKNSKKLNVLTKYDVETLDPQSFDRLIMESLDEEIDDKDKSDAFAKTVAFIQVSYTIAKAAIRTGQHLPLSEFEVTTFAYILCSFFSYFFWWSKPRDLRRPIVLKLREPHFPPQVRRPNQSFDINMKIFAIGLFSFATAVGAIHLVAWNFSFPTLVELWIWRSASIVTTTLPLIILSVYLVQGLLPEKYMTDVLWFGFPLGGLYILVRLTLLAQSLACLRSLPKGVYAPVWADVWPHL